MQANAQNKLRMIAEQMQFLKKQAEKVLIDAKENAMLHHAACNFVKHPGNIYHLYEKSTGQCYFSMLSVEVIILKKYLYYYLNANIILLLQEWGNNGPLQVYKGSYRLEQDHSWTPVSEIKSKDTELDIFNRCLSTHQFLRIDSPDSMCID